ncbi:MAG: hypothetical protein M3O50_17235 [Myxococcota bacterium]|nr:hypothetical protein [Myxococcota bacterium]
MSASSEFEERPSSTREYATITRHLQKPFGRYSVVDVFAPRFAIVALSHMASGMLNVYVAEPDKRSEVHAHVLEVQRRALLPGVSPHGTATTASTPMDDHNLFLSHLALILGIERYTRCDGRPCPLDCDSDRLFERIVMHLRARSLATGVFNAPSYPGSPMWPADQTVSLLAMKLYDATRGTSLHREPMQGLLGILRARRDPQTGLFPSSLSPIAHAQVPRGCATSWSVSYLAQLDLPVAREQYTRARTSLWQQVLGLGGFREWPRGREGGVDIDSGPVVFGIGVAATGLGLGPARIFRDAASYTVIRRTALVFGVPAWWTSGGYWTAPLLGEAILFDGRTSRPWFGEAAAVPPSHVPPAIAPALLLLVGIAIVAASVRAVAHAL